MSGAGLGGELLEQEAHPEPLRNLVRALKLLNSTECPGAPWEGQRVDVNQFPRMLDRQSDHRLKISDITVALAVLS